MVAPGGLDTKQHSGMAVQDLGAQEYAVRMTALDEAEVERTISSIWPGAEIIAIGLTAQPGLVDDQRRSSARQAERMPGSEIA